jgi:hypothetical protein
MMTGHGFPSSDLAGMATAMITHRGHARAAAGWVSPVTSASGVG